MKKLLLKGSAICFVAGLSLGTFCHFYVHSGKHHPTFFGVMFVAHFIPYYILDIKLKYVENGKYYDNFKLRAIYCLSIIASLVLGSVVTLVIFYYLD